MSLHELVDLSAVNCDFSDTAEWDVVPGTGGNLDLEALLAHYGDAWSGFLAPLTGKALATIKVGARFGSLSSEEKARLLDFLRSMPCKNLRVVFYNSDDVEGVQEITHRDIALALGTLNCESIALSFDERFSSEEISVELRAALSRPTLKKININLFNHGDENHQDPREFLPLTHLLHTFEEVVVQCPRFSFSIENETFQSLMLAATRGIQVLKIACDFLEEHFELLAEAISDSYCSLKELRLVLDNLCFDHVPDGLAYDTSLADFTTAIARSTNLRVLEITAPEVPLPMCVRFGLMLDRNVSLEYFRLKDFPNDLGAAAFALGMRNNTTLQTLEVDGNVDNVGDNFGLFVADILRGPSGLRKLGLRNDRLTDTSASAFASSLVTNTTLQELDLSDNTIRVPGIRALLGALHVNSTLVSLDLSKMFDVSLDIWPDVVQVLERNSHLKQLTLTGMKVKEGSLMRLVEALRTNNSMEELCVGGFDQKPLVLGQESYQRMVDMLDENTTLVGFHVHCLCSEQKKIIRMYEILNKAVDRAALKGSNVERADWMRALFAVKDEPLDCLFYMLSKCPFVLQEE